MGAHSDIARHVPDELAPHTRLVTWISQTSSGLRSVTARDFLIAAAIPDLAVGYSPDRFAAALCSDAQLDRLRVRESFGWHSLLF
jgi:hypothetical protein